MGSVSSGQGRLIPGLVLWSELESQFYHLSLNLRNKIYIYHDCTNNIIKLDFNKLCKFIEYLLNIYRIFIEHL